MSALLKISTLSLSFRVCKRLAQSAAVPKSIQTLFLLCHFLQLVNVCCLAHTDSCWRDWPYGCQLPDSLWQRSCAKLTKSNHEKPDSVELNAASTKRQGKVLFFFFFYWKCPECGSTIWSPDWCKYPVNSPYPHLLKGSRGGSGGGRGRVGKERDDWRQNERQTQRRLRGRGELGWKDSGEQSEINLDTPDGLKFVCAFVCVTSSTCVRLRCCQLVYFEPCI